MNDKEKYIRALIIAVGLDDCISPYDSAIELSWYGIDRSDNKGFSADGYYALYRLVNATDKEKARAIEIMNEGKKWLAEMKNE